MPNTKSRIGCFIFTLVMLITGVTCLIWFFAIKSDVDVKNEIVSEPKSSIIVGDIVNSHHDRTRSHILKTFASTGGMVVGILLILFGIRQYVDQRRHRLTAEENQNFQNRLSEIITK